MRIVLASQSVRRGRALEMLGLPYEKIPSGFDESCVEDPDLAQLARKLAEAKARAVGERERGAIIVSGDLIAVVDGTMYDKPADEEEAVRMLLGFSGKRMRILSGIAVYAPSRGKMLSTTEEFTVAFRELTEREIRQYVSRYPVTRFAGGFDGDALQRFAVSSQGSFPHLMGLPMSPLILFLREMGVDV
jgi:MAF protein